MKEIAIFGGTFDPPTLAHEGIIDTCLAQDHLDEVWLMPSGCRSDKPGMSSNAARLAMLEVVRTGSFEENERLLVTDFEQRLPQPTQTYDTVRKLNGAYPECRFWFVYGADAYYSMTQWKKGEWLRQNLDMLLIDRPGHPLPPPSDRIKHIEVPDIDGNVSSSGFHEACRTGLPLERFVSDAVLKHLAGRSLYGSKALARVEA
jgi:nicotinate-nucleotide adenylyltransferase